MDSKKIEKAINDELDSNKSKEYHPEILSVNLDDIDEVGTKIILKKLKNLHLH